MKLTENIEILELSMNRMGQTSFIYPTLIRDNGKNILVDTGLISNVSDIEEYLTESGLIFEDIDTIIVSHQDLDHIGGLPKIVELSGGKTEVLSHKEEQPYITGEKQFIRMNADNLMAALNSLPENMRSQMEELIDEAKQYKGVKVTKTVEDGEILPYIGGITVIHTSGHTPGHICLYLNQSKILIAGDALDIVDGQLFGPKPGLSADEMEAKNSIKKFLKYDIKTVICYHGGIYSDNVNQRILELSNTL